MHLKTQHRYYTLVQLQMFLSQCQHCDFMYNKCETTLSLAIVRIRLDIDFCRYLVVKCHQFIHDHVVKETVT